MDQQLESLKETVARLLRRQAELEARVQALERDGRAGQPPPLPVSGAPRPVYPPPSVASPPPAYAAATTLPSQSVQTPPPGMPPDPAMPPPLGARPVFAGPIQGGPPPLPPNLPYPLHPNPPGAPSAALETTFGLNWINRIAVVTLILGAGFLFKYGVDNDWFGPGARVAMGLFAAVAVLFAGDHLWRRGQAVFASGISGLGLALAYLSLYAASSLYHFLPQSLAFVLMSGVTVAAGWLALRYGAQAVAALGMAGGYLTPVLLSTGEDHPWILFGYVFLLNLGGLALARLPRWTPRWRVIEVLALASTVALYVGWMATWLSPENRPVATLFAVLFYAQFGAVESVGVWGAVQLLAPGAMVWIWDAQARFLPWELLFVAGGLIGADLRKWSGAPVWTLLCYWFPLSVWVWGGRIPPAREVAFGWMSLAFALFFLWTPFWTFLRNRQPRVVELITLALNAGAYFAAGYFLLDPVQHQYMGLFAAVVGGLHLGLAWMLPRSDGRLLAAGVAIAFSALAVPIQFTGFVITGAWTLEAAALAWVASRADPSGVGGEWLRRGATALFTLVLARLLLVDAWMYMTGADYRALANARFVTFAVSAVSLWLAARWTRAAQVQDWAYWGAGVAYVAGHLVFLAALALEVGGWVDRSVAPADQSSMRAISSSLLMAIYAVGLVTLGVLTRTALNRILGLALVSVVIAKLYLIDVWELSRLSRIAGFLALGVLLLAMSYLYSRFKPTLDRLWKVDPEV